MYTSGSKLLLLLHVSLTDIDIRKMYICILKIISVYLVIVIEAISRLTEDFRVSTNVIAIV